MNSQVLPFSKEHISQAIELWSSAGLDPYTGEIVQAFLDRSPGLSQVAVSDKKVVGTVLAGFDGKYVHLSRLYVDESMREQGIGKRMIGEVEKAVRKTDARGISIECREELVDWYKSQGFEKSESVTLFKKL